MSQVEGEKEGRTNESVTIKESKPNGIKTGQIKDTDSALSPTSFPSLPFPSVRSGKKEKETGTLGEGGADRTTGDQKTALLPTTRTHTR